MSVISKVKFLSIALTASTILTSFNAVAKMNLTTAENPSACQRRDVRSIECGHWSKLSLKDSPNAWKYDNSQIPNTAPHQGRWYNGEKVEHVRVVVLEGIEFDFNKSNIRASSYPIMDQNVDGLKSKTTTQVKIVGHTDAIGSDEANQKLSEQRAASALDYFVAHGVDSTRLTSEGRGESEPVAPNKNADGSDNPDGRARNRRIELHITSR
jgi:outer membrane protein OmpA-like peptidoglycan-associated protein